MSKQKLTIEDLQRELAEVHARLDRHSLILEQLEKSVEDAKDDAGSAYSRAEEAWNRIEDIENKSGV
jgi:uncharacterized coiled-coil protein SlyX